MIDAKSLQGILKETFGTSEPVEPRLIKLKSDIAVSVESTNEKLERVFEKPLGVALVGDNRSREFTVSTDELKNIITVSYNSPEGTKLSIAKDALAEILPKKLATLPSKKSLSLVRTEGEVLEAATERYNGNERSWISIPFDDGPNTTGTIAAKYIEVDISQQTMYLFERGSIKKSHKVSTGYYYPTPIGTFTILNKAPNAFSEIYDVWMPYWMAFSYSSENNAYFGIHELPYAVDEGGRHVARSSDWIGRPTTGGCIALDIGSSKEVYAWADIGTPITIYE